MLAQLVTFQLDQMTVADASVQGSVLYGLVQLVFKIADKDFLPFFVQNAAVQFLVEMLFLQFLLFSTLKMTLSTIIGLKISDMSRQSE